MVSLTIRPVQQGDRDRLLEILIETRQWTDREIADAVLQIDTALQNANRWDYTVYVAERTTERGDRVEGYACYGPTPKTEGVFDLYWIAVDPAAQGSGVGTALLRDVEKSLTAMDARMLLIETSSKESFRPAVEFYRSRGYEEVSRIKDFYRTQHDKIIFCRKFD